MKENNITKERIPEEFCIVLAGRLYDAREVNTKDLLHPAMADIIFSIPGGKEALQRVAYSILMAGMALEKAKKFNRKK